MADNNISPSTQLRFCALLRYYQHGDFPSFSRIAELALGAYAAAEPYLCANLLFASQVCGLCEISTASGKTQWWVSHDKDISVPSRAPKMVAATTPSLSFDSGSLEALITDGNHRPIIFGRRLVTDSNEQSPYIFDNALSRVLAPFKELEKQLCTEVPFSDNIEGNAQIFNNVSSRWEPISLNRISGPRLFRVRKDYSGYSYYVQYSELGIRFKITQPEWAFVVAYHLLPWKLSDLLVLQGGGAAFPRAVRLPAIMCRLLFAAADNMQLGPLVNFRGVRASCITGFREYFESVGVRQ